ncbi:MAG: hypothetical protein OXQ92_05815 [Boseongicola sp.]|nr:hypothetical protein [Boseongicola sp.]MDD9976581.1 hypothetical protein [Boseongicola sp.]
MAERRLIAIITAMLLVPNSATAQESATIDQLRQIEEMVTNRAWRQLYDYLSANPRIVSGNGPLATELCGFVTDVERGNLDVFVSPWDRFTNSNRFDENCVIQTAAIY